MTMVAAANTGSGYLLYKIVSALVDWNILFGIAAITGSLLLIIIIVRVIAKRRNSKTDLLADPVETLFWITIFCAICGLGAYWYVN